MPNIMDIEVGDIIRLRKKHPCGSDRWLVLGTGVDFRLKCLGCQHIVLIERLKLEHKLKGRVIKGDVSHPL